MNKLKQVLMVAALLALPLIMSVPANAVEANDGDSCTIENTGEGSNNECTTSDNYTCRVDNETNVVTVFNNGQVVASGTATTSGNGTGGDATSGSATNSNGTVFNIEIENEGCEVTQVTEPTPTPTPTPAPEPQGMGAVEAKPTVLANTSSIDFAPIALAVVAAGIAAVVAVRGFTAYASRR